MVEARQATPIPLDLSVACSEGELLAVVGPSGSGKSTLLRTIAGLYRPSEARVICGGEVWSDAARGIHVPTYRRQVGMVFQSYALFPHMTALANVGAAMGHLPRALRKDRARELLELMHLGGFALRRPAELSGGQQQRVAVARALARDPAVLLLDEPFSAVDRPTRRRLHDDLSELRRSVLIPILLVTHDLDEALGLADRLLVLDRGTVLQAGKPSAVLAAPASLRVAELLDVPSA
jgi:molybdate transport system ATP-binding protein